MSALPPQLHPFVRRCEQLPELALLPDETGRREVVKAVVQRVFHNNVFAILYSGTLTLISILTAKFVRARFGAFVIEWGLPLLTIDLLFLLGLMAAMMFGTFWLFSPSVRRALRRELVARGIAVCLRCGYDCRGQREPRCPECGTRFDPKLLTPPENLP